MHRLPELAKSVNRDRKQWSEELRIITFNIALSKLVSLLLEKNKMNRRISISTTASRIYGVA